MKQFGNRIAGAAVAAVLAALLACGGASDGGSTAPRPVAEVVITSPALPPSFGSLGRSIQFSAEARDASGAVVSGKAITWSTSNSGVAAITPSGLVSAAGVGTAEVRASADGVNSAPVTVTVGQATASVAVTPATVTFGAKGSTQQLTATALDTTGHPISGRTATWSVANAAVAVVTADGLVTAVGNGTTQVSGSIDGVAGATTVTVAIVAASLTLSPRSKGFSRIGDSLQVSAAALDANSNPVADPAITWTSKNLAVATVDAGGKIFSVADGTTYVVAATGGGARDSVAVTVNAVASTVVTTPAALVFGALGSTRELTAAVRDSAGRTIPGRTVTWTRAGPGTVATVSGDGLVTALGVGIGDTAVASATGPAGPIVAKVPITVTQVVNAVTVSSFSPSQDTIKTTGRTVQLAAAAADSNGNAIPAVAFTWASNSSDVATVDATGLVSAVSDGTAGISATAANGKAGIHNLVVRRVALTFTLFPTAPQSIATAGGTLAFTGTAQDSVGTNLAISWLSRRTEVATVGPTSGTSTTATARGNGSTYIVMSGGTRRDSTSLAVTNQTAPSADVEVGDNFFRSVSNSTQNPAVDTVAVGGTVTWTWVGVASHGVLSTGTPSFVSSTTKTGGTYAFQFNLPGTYTYECTVHGAAMSGRVVVR